MYRQIIMTFFVFVLFATYAKAEKTPKEEDPKAVMHKAFQAVFELLPYSVHEMKFKDKRHEALILSKMMNISDAFKSGGHLEVLRAAGFYPSLELMQEHIKETIDAFNNKNKTFARLSLNSTTSICISCHTQFGEDHKSSFSSPKNRLPRSKFSSDFDYANFLFLVQDYEEAVNSYKKAIAMRLKNKEKTLKELKNEKKYEFSVDFVIEQSLRRVLTYYLKIKPDLRRAKIFLEEQRKEKRVSQILKEEIEDWLEDIDLWGKAKVDFRRLSTDESVDKFIIEHLDPRDNEEEGFVYGKDDVTLLLASGILSKNLGVSTDATRAPKLIYWLAQADKYLNDQYFFSLSTVYLKSCITRYKNPPYQKKCYKLYEDYLTEGYTGSSGTDIPEDEKRELKRLKGYL